MMPHYRRRRFGDSYKDYSDRSRSRDFNGKSYTSKSRGNNSYRTESDMRSFSRSRCGPSRRKRRSSRRSSAYRCNNRRQGNGDSDYSSGTVSRNMSHLGPRGDSNYFRTRKRRHSSISTKSHEQSYKRRRSSREYMERRPYESDVSDENDFESFDEGSYTDVNNREKSVVKDDKEGHLVMSPGQMIRRFKVEKVLGEGTFGRVVRCVEVRNDDRKEKNRRSSYHKVALKVIKNISKYRDAARYEINVLRVLNERDPLRRFNCVRALSWFNYHGHVCIVFEMLGLSIFDFLEKNEFSPYPIDHVQVMAYQLISAVNFLHVNKITHTDLKPENVLLIDDAYDMKYCSKTGRPKRILRSPSIRLIDFGSATFEYEHHTTIVSTRHYRAPEVILELGWSYSCDVWSIGCILFEIFTGIALFMTHDNLEHLAMMERALGRRIPSRMVRRTRKRKYFYHGRLDWDSHTDDGRYVRHNVRPLTYHFSPSIRGERHLLNLIQELLRYNPRERLSLEDALKHPFFDTIPQCYMKADIHRRFRDVSRDSSSGQSRRSFSKSKQRQYSRTLSSRS